MNRQHPWPHEMGNRSLISITVSEIRDHCQNLLDDPRTKMNSNVLLICVEAGRCWKMTLIRYEGNAFSNCSL